MGDRLSELLPDLLPQLERPGKWYPTQAAVCSSLEGGYIAGMFNLHAFRLTPAVLAAITALLLAVDTGWTQYSRPTWECRRCNRTLDSPICRFCQAEQTRKMVASRQAKQNASYERGKAAGKGMAVLTVFGGFAGLMAFIIGALIANGKKKSARRRIASTSGHPRSLPQSLAFAEEEPSPPPPSRPPPPSATAPPARRPSATAKPPAKAAPPKSRKPPIKKR